MISEWRLTRAMAELEKRTLLTRVTYATVHVEDSCGFAIFRHVQAKVKTVYAGELGKDCSDWRPRKAGARSIGHRGLSKAMSVDACCPSNQPVPRLPFIRCSDRYAGMARQRLTS